MRSKLGSLAYTALLAGALLLSVVLLSHSTSVMAQEAPPKMEGVAYTSWWHGEYSSAGSDQTLAIIDDVGAEWISILATWYQDTLTSTTIYSHTDRTPTDADVIHAIETAHALGLNVLLKPHLDVMTEEWRGEIGEGGFTTEAEWDAWFTSYQAFINHYAQIAADYEVEMFCVGTELDKTAVEELRWRDVITGTGGITSIYDGDLVYAANHTYTNTVMFWDAVDYIGIDAYYAVAVTTTATLADFKVGWTEPLSFLAELAEEWDKDIVFTELGYRSVDGAGMIAWEYQGAPPMDMQEQADLYQAFFEEVFPQEWFAGIFWWNWTTNPMQGGPCDRDYAVLDKPAELILRQYFNGNPKEGAGNLTPRPNEIGAWDIYTDQLRPWAWTSTWNNSTVVFTDTDEVYAGQYAIRSFLTGPSWGALQIGPGTSDSSPYYWLEFYINQQNPDHAIQVIFDGGNTLDYCRYTVAEEDGWRQVRIPLDKAGISDTISWFAYQTKGNDTTLWLDNIRLLGVFSVELSDGYAQEAKQGASVTYTHVLQNFHSTTDTLSVEAMSSRDWPLHLVVGGESGTTYMGPIRLGSWETTTVQVVLTVPPTETVGITDTTTIVATSLSQPEHTDSLEDITTVLSGTRYIYLPLIMRSYPAGR